MPGGGGGGGGGTVHSVLPAYQESWPSGGQGFLMFLHWPSIGGTSLISCPRVISKSGLPYGVYSYLME